MSGEEKIKNKIRKILDEDRKNSNLKRYRVTFTNPDEDDECLDPIEVEAINEQDAIGEGIYYILENSPWCMVKDVEEIDAEVKGD